LLPRRYVTLNEPINTCVLTRAAVQTIPTGVLTVVVWDAPTIIDNNVFSYNVGTGVLTTNITGIYNITFNQVWLANVNGTRLGVIDHNDGTAVRSLSSSIASLVTTANVVVSVTRRFISSANISFSVLQNIGANLNLGGNASLRAEIYRLGDLD